MSVPATAGVSRTRAVELPDAAACTTQPMAAVPAIPTMPVAGVTLAIVPAARESAGVFATPESGVHAKAEKDEMMRPALFTCLLVTPVTAGDRSQGRTSRYPINLCRKRQIARESQH